MWDAFQQDVLAALGYELLRVADAPLPAPPAMVVPPDGPPLWRALFRAAAGDPSRLSALPPLEQLSTPAAKRALWPQLRALRRASRQ